MNEVYISLLELQRLDRDLRQSEARLSEIQPQIDEVDAPIAALQKEIDTSRSRLEEMREKQKKLEQAANSKRERLKSYEARLERVRNPREEAAAKTEMDLVRRAIDADEQESIELLEQARRTDLKLDDLDRALQRLTEEAHPRRNDILTAQSTIQDEIARLREKRTSHTSQITPNALRLYDRVRGPRGDRAALAPLKSDGACGNCFNVVPLQERAEIRSGRELRRCEACGVILYPEDETPQA